MADAEAGAPAVALSDEERNDIALLARELPSLAQQLQELDLLLQQQEQELESQRARAQSAAEAVRKLEASGSYTREQYQQVVAQAHQGELRALTVQHQLESLRSRRDSVDQLIGVVEFALALGRRIDPTAAAATPKPPPPPSVPVVESAPVAAPPPPSEVAVIEAQEAERAWIAQQLHNGPAQSLTNLILRAEICQRLVDTDAAAAKNELADLRQTIFQSLQGMRRFIFDVRPMILDDLGLYPALRRFVDDWHEQGHPSVALTLIGPDRRFSRAVELTAFRIIQDAIKAPEGGEAAGVAAVQVMTEQDTLRITLESPGPRFEAKVDGLPAGYHTIGQRAAIVGGQVSVESRPGVRSLKVAIPVSET